VRATSPASSWRSVNDISERNKRKVRLFVEAVWNEGRLELISELVADDYVGHMPCAGREILGPRGLRRLVSSQRRAHPDLHVKIEDQIAEEDRVVTRWHAMIPAPSARTAGAPTGLEPCCAGISIVRLLAGKQVDSHTEYPHLTAHAQRTPAAQTEAGAR
jgi:predicted SnoaL-like aldol condensation-catalyzing enzyme